MLAELLGDVYLLLERLDSTRADISNAELGAKQTVAALVEANENYRQQIDHLMARLRVEFAGLLTTATTHAIGLQAATLQTAAVLAVRQAVNNDIAARQKRASLTMISLSAAVATVVTLLFLGMAKAFAWI